MATLANLRTRLRTVSSTIATSDSSSEVVFDNDALDQVITDSLNEFDPTKTVGTLLTKEEFPLILLSWANTHLIRAGKYTRFFAMESPDGGGDKAEPLEHHLKMYEVLYARYVAAAQQAGVGLGGSGSLTGPIEVGTITRVDTLGDIETPDTFSAVPGTLTITATAGSASGNVDLVWTESEDNNFYLYRIYRHTSTGLKDLTRLTASGAKYLGIIDAATEVVSVQDRWKLSYRDTDLTSGTTYYYVVQAVSLNLKVSISDESSVAAP